MIELYPKPTQLYSISQLDMTATEIKVVDHIGIT